MTMTMLTFSLNVVDVQGAKVSVARGPLTTARVALLTEKEANDKVDAVKGVDRKKRFGRLTYDTNGLTPTHAHTKDGIYQSKKQFDEGKYLLVVWAPDKAPTVQRLTLSQKKGVTVVKAGWAGSKPPDANLQAFNVEFPAASQGKGAPMGSLVTVKAVPAVEFVLLAGTGYWHKHDGTRWINFAHKYRSTLWTQKQMLGGYLVTIFNCEECNRRTYVKALGNDDSWLLIEEVKTNADRKFTDSSRPDDDIGILDLYGYLNTIGDKRPGSVWEVDVFTHSWAGGPILWDTEEDDAHKGVSDRDPKDLDARSKDWIPPTSGKHPNRSKAHLFKAVWKLWGCNAQTEVRQGILAVEKQLKPTFDRNAVFSYDFEQRHYQLTLAHFLKELAENMANGYSGHVPAGVGQTVGCYASAPGFGSSMGGNKLFITEHQSVIDGKPAAPGAPDTQADLAARPLFNFYRRELGSNFKYLVTGNGYFEFRFLLEEVKNWPTPIFTTARYLFIDTPAQGSNQPLWAVRVASGAYVVSQGAAPVKLTQVSAENGLVVAGKKGHLFAGKGGQFSRVSQGSLRRVMVVPATGRDCAVFMQENGVLYAMKRTGSNPWTVDTSPIPVMQGSASAGTITNGILEQVTPGFIW